MREVVVYHTWKGSSLVEIPDEVEDVKAYVDSMPFELAEQIDSGGCSLTDWSLS